MKEEEVQEDNGQLIQCESDQTREQRPREKKKKERGQGGAQLRQKSLRPKSNLFFTQVKLVLN